jgi:pyruvate formate-lyase activating enzyme-like uncharacterized protein
LGNPLLAEDREGESVEDIDEGVELVDASGISIGY